MELPPSSCDLNSGDCHGELPFGSSFTLRLSPRPIPVATPLAVEVEFQGALPERVELDLDGVDMHMPQTRPILQATGAGRFAATTELPVCITSTMQWRATLLVTHDGNRYSIPFLLETRASN